MTLTQKIKQQAQALGFDLVGIIRIEPSQTIDFYARWLAAGYAGEMGYLHEHFFKKHDLRRIQPEAQSVIMLGANYHSSAEALPEAPSRGRISRYAWGGDYHLILREKLEALRRYIEAEASLTHEGMRVYVDTGPVLEREHAQRAGLGWFGKHSNLIHWRFGSWFFISEVLVNLPLEEDRVENWGECGACTLCLEACPTEAIVAERTVDATRCISYLTIELKGAIPRELRPQIGNWIVGCDLCQEVCPWNRQTPLTQEPRFYSQAVPPTPDLCELMSLTPEGFNERFRRTPLKRLKRRGLLRNVAVALGNWGNPLAIPALAQGLGDPEPLIRQHSAWALGRIAHPKAHSALQAALSHETEEAVLLEIREALSLDP